ncbi:3-deoxy-D-manno-octulosonic acid transferase [Falsigemmobacter faecalis]|uniref:3-deoxy-D-manno-octulosonic acid transferase n=1 Tax=Falsigemmobacter faecalis TaxID=2488730 RepID=UPI001315136B|nr:glycosyltransferase N-terminal domain-containing protein [Falsigemmobacter faecalis]
MLSPGLRLYRFLRGPAPGGSESISGERPSGRLAWLHAPDAAAVLAFRPLMARLRDERMADHFLLTCAEPGVPGTLAPPADEPALAAAFLDHWRPDYGIWASGGLRPVLLYTAAARHLPVVLTGGTEPGLGAGRLIPRLMRGLFAAFRQIFVTDQTAARAFLRVGAPPARLEVAGRMEEASHSLPVPEAEREALSRILGTRPVWLAVGVPEEEEALVIRAHLKALHSAHRLLLILVPASADRIPALLRDLPGSYGLEAGYRAADEDPDEDTQVYLADDDEPGLWYRLAPLTWAGGSLKGAGPMRHPFEAAAAGSALLHGPNFGPYLHAMERLQSAGGARLVPRGEELGDVVGDMLAPDRCARIAQAAWAVTSEGGEASDKVIAAVSAILDSKGARS